MLREGGEIKIIGERSNLGQIVKFEAANKELFD